MKNLISFHYSNYFIYIILYSLSTLLKDYLEKECKIIGNNPFLIVILMYFGESWAFFFYLYEKYQFKKKKNIKVFQQFIPKKNKTNLIIFILFWCTIIDLFSSTPLIFFYNHSMKKIEYDNYFTTALIYFFLYLHESFYLKIESYFHQQLGIGINFVSLLITFIFLIIDQINYTSIKSFICLMILLGGKNYLHSFLFIFEKKINYEYYVNMNYICCVEGIMGIILVLIINVGVFFFYNAKRIFIIDLNTKFENIPYLIIIIFFYVFFHFMLNFSRLKIAEIKKPSYVIIGKSLSFLYLSIINFIFNKNRNQSQNIFIIICMINSVFGTLIFSEILILHFCDLDKNTLKVVVNRAERETQYDILEIDNIKDDN